MRYRTWQDIAVAVLVAAAIFVLSPQAWSGATALADPALPSYGQEVSVRLQGGDRPVYSPATRYARSGATFTLDYALAPNGFGPERPDPAEVPVPLGEVAPGNYTLVARFFDAQRPDAPAEIVTSSFVVLPPEYEGVYLAPREPGAYEPLDVLVRAADYLDPASMHATVSGTTVRVDFSYAPGARVKMAAHPPGTVAFAMVRIPGLPAGTYRLEAWGHPASGGAAQLTSACDFAVSPMSPVVEYYSPSLGQYLLAAKPREIAALDSGAQPGWKRTGWRFNAWLREEDAPSQAQPVCRYYDAASKSHYYAIDPGICRSPGAGELGEGTAPDAGPVTGSKFEMVAFWALLPQDGRCPAGARPVYAAKNARAAPDASNDRFMVDTRLRSEMSADWIDEGVAFCSPS